jgi:hypothetical protein
LTPAGYANWKNPELNMRNWEDIQYLGYLESEAGRFALERSVVFLNGL